MHTRIHAHTHTHIHVHVCMYHAHTCTHARMCATHSNPPTHTRTHLQRYQSRNIVARLKTLTQEAETESEVRAMTGCIRRVRS